MKIIMFDLVGVLVGELDIKMTDIQSKIERLFGPNKSDSEFLEQAKLIIDDKKTIDESVNYLINNLYKQKYPNLVEVLKKKYPDIKIIIATNHVSTIVDFINKEFNVDGIYISALINKIKPSIDFYEYIIEKEKVQPKEILFLDDNIKNIEGALNCNINTIHVTREMDLLYEIERFLNNN